MENRIDRYNQNPRRAGENSVFRPTQEPKKKKINYWMVSTILLSAILLAGSPWLVLNTEKRSSLNQQAAPGKTNEIVVTGVFRTSGLNEEEKQKLNLTAVNYQITDFGDYQKAFNQAQTAGYYLLSNTISDELLGKCVRATGVIPKEWKNKNKTDTYNRLALNLTNLERIDNSNCNPYGQTQPLFDSAQEKLALQGTVFHAKRPASDIGYDYQLKLTGSFVDKLSPVKSSQEVNLVDVSPTTNSLWNKLENNIDKEVSVLGYMVWGYAESRYFQIVDINSTNNTMEVTEVKNLIARFEKHLQDKNVNELMALFTPAKTTRDIESYRSLMGPDDDAKPRLFNNADPGFIVTNWNIAKKEYPDNDELITKDNDRYFIIVEETRRNWCNTGYCAGTYALGYTSLYVFEVIKQDPRWLVDKYYHQPASPKTVASKYQALNF